MSSPKDNSAPGASSQDCHGEYKWDEWPNEAVRAYDLVLEQRDKAIRERDAIADEALAAVHKHGYTFTPGKPGQLTASIDAIATMPDPAAEIAALRLKVEGLEAEHRDNCVEIDKLRAQVRSGPYGDWPKHVRAAEARAEKAEAEIAMRDANLTETLADFAVVTKQRDEARAEIAKLREALRKAANHCSPFIEETVYCVACEGLAEKPHFRDESPTTNPVAHKPGCALAAIGAKP